MLAAQPLHYFASPAMTRRKKKKSNGGGGGGSGVAAAAAGAAPSHSGERVPNLFWRSMHHSVLRIQEPYIALQPPEQVELDGIDSLR